MTVARCSRMIMRKSNGSITCNRLEASNVRILVIGLIILLALLHHDWWWWDAKEPLVLGFMPVGLAWHAGISLAAGLVGLVAVKFCWPDHLDDEDDDPGSGIGPTGKEEAN